MSKMIEIIKRDFGFYKDFKAIFSNKKARNKFLLTLLLVPIFIIYVVLFMSYMLSSYDQFVTLGIKNQFLMSGFSMFLMVTIFFITPFIVSKIYFSNHMKILLRYPFTDKELLGSRLIYLIIYSLIYSLAITVPIIVKYGMAEGKGILFYIKALLLIVGISAITISFLAMIVIFIMKFINKNASLKKVLKYLISVVFFLLIVFVQIVIQSQAFSAGGGEIIKTAGRTANIITNFVPQLKLAQLALTVNNEIASWGFVSLMIILAFVMTYIAINFFSKMMIDGVLSSNTIQRKKIKTKDNTRSVYREIYGKEMKNIFSNSMYFLNKVMFGILVPIFMAIPLYFGLKQSGIELGFLIESYNELYDGIINSFDNPTLLIAAVSIAASIILSIFVGSGAEIASTTFTREGKNLWMMKAFPIKTNDQLLARVMASADIIIISSIPTLVLFAYLLKFHIVAMFLLIIANVITAISISCITLTVGIINVKPDWDNAQQAIKGLVGIVSLLICFLLGFILFYPGIHFYRQLEKNILYYPFVQLLVIALLGIVFYIINVKLYNSKVDKLGNK